MLDWEGHMVAPKEMVQILLLDVEDNHHVAETAVISHVESSAIDEVHTSLDESYVANIMLDDLLNEANEVTGVLGGLAV